MGRVIEPAPALQAYDSVVVEGFPVSPASAPALKAGTTQAIQSRNFSNWRGAMSRDMLAAGVVGESRCASVGLPACCPSTWTCAHAHPSAAGGNSVPGTVSTARVLAVAGRTFANAASTTIRRSHGGRCPAASGPVGVNCHGRSGLSNSICARSLGSALGVPGSGYRRMISRGLSARTSPGPRTVRFTVASSVPESAVTGIFIRTPARVGAPVLKVLVRVAAMPER